MIENRLERYSSVMAEMGARPGNVRFHCEYLFDGIDLEDKTMLDVGAGDGRYSLYAGCVGARRVVSLEPESAGSRTGMQERFKWAASTLGAQDVELVTQRLQDYEPRGEDFDVVLLHGSINHLDEQACIGLHRDPAAQHTYRVLFEKLAALSRPGGVLIVSDCSRENLFARLGIKNPIARNIEWHKHQTPELWARMLADAGFSRPRIRWASFNTFRSAGRLLLGNRAAAYCLTSTFCLTMERSSGRSVPEVTKTLAAAR